MSILTSYEVFGVWRGRYAEAWRERTGGVTAADYAEIVAQQRVGERKSLSFNYLIGHGLEENTNRRQIRAEIDAIVTELKGDGGSG